MQKELYRRYMPAMYNKAVRMLSDKEMAKDIIQEVFTQVFKDIGQFRGDATLGAWIKTITIHKCLDYLKANSKWKIIEMSEHFDIEEEVKNPISFDVQKIHTAIQQLPKGCRTVFNLYLMEGYQHQEIAQILGITESTSKSQYNRAKKLLQALLQSK